MKALREAVRFLALLHLMGWQPSIQEEIRFAERNSALESPLFKGKLAKDSLRPALLATDL